MVTSYGDGISPECCGEMCAWVTVRGSGRGPRSPWSIAEGARPELEEGTGKFGRRGLQNPPPEHAEATPLQAATGGGGADSESLTNGGCRVIA